MQIKLGFSYKVTPGASGIFFKVGEKAQPFQINARGRLSKSINDFRPQPLIWNRWVFSPTLKNKYSGT